MKLIRTILILAMLSVIAVAGYYAFYPDVSNLKKKNPKKTSFMEYREAEWSKQGKKVRIQKKWVSLSNISPFIIKAVLIAEDDKFWRHQGFDFDAIQKAIETDIKKKKFKFGGSTISQQLAKNLYLTPSKNPVRKFKEAILTWRIEQNLSKKRILELYLNVVEWGEGIFGIEAASQHYYKKSALYLSPDEAAHLAVILPNPRRYRLDGSSGYVEKRAKIVYNIMVKRGIVEPEYEDVLKNSGEEQPIS